MKQRLPQVRSSPFREQVRPGDSLAVRQLVTATGFFSPEEQDIAEELVLEASEKGEASGYFFLFHEDQEMGLTGYSCYGPIPGTQSSFDLYWIVVSRELQGKGLGRRLLKQSELEIRKRAGTRVYAETSDRAQYKSTRAFYAKCGYFEAAFLPHFYAPSDGKVIYAKELAEVG